MLFTFSNLTTDNGLQDFSMEFEAKGCTVLFDSCETLSRGVLSALAGLDEILAGSLLIDGIPQKMYFSRNQLIATLGLVFDEGIMLSNLSLKENILLPWRKRFEGGNLSSFEQQLKKWMELLKMDTDLSLRPAHVSPATRKFLGYVRAMLLKPKLLLIDDPYYLFNKMERKRIFTFLYAIKEEQEMIIASADDDFLGDIATQVFDLSCFCK